MKRPHSGTGKSEIAFRPPHLPRGTHVHVWPETSGPNGLLAAEIRPKVILTLQTPKIDLSGPLRKSKNGPKNGKNGQKCILTISPAQNHAKLARTWNYWPKRPPRGRDRSKCDCSTLETPKIVSQKIEKWPPKSQKSSFFHFDHIIRPETPEFSSDLKLVAQTAS